VPGREGGVSLVCDPGTKREKASVDTAVGVVPDLQWIRARDQPEALKAKSVDLRRMRIHRRTDLTLDDLARWLNPIVSGWINYHGGSTGPRSIPSSSASTST
jgi:hypothetical protein